MPALNVVLAYISLGRHDQLTQSRLAKLLSVCVYVRACAIFMLCVPVFVDFDTLNISMQYMYYVQQQNNYLLHCTSTTSCTTFFSCFREEDKNYKFNMNALHSFLNEQISKSPGPAKFYNVQVFRYEVQYILCCIVYEGEDVGIE